MKTFVSSTESEEDDLSSRMKQNAMISIGPQPVFQAPPQSETLPQRSYNEFEQEASSPGVTQPQPEKATTEEDKQKKKKKKKKAKDAMGDYSQLA